MIITKQWIHDHKTPAGGWNRKQMTAIGVPWPQPRGWIKSVEGKLIDYLAKASFEAGAKSPPAKESLEDRVSRLEAQIKQLYLAIELK